MKNTVKRVTSIFIIMLMVMGSIPGTQLLTNRGERV
ncbi:hypothetical protein PAPH110629_10645 [Paenibacillus phoenicis]